jgi:hypothetical protein
VDQAGAGGTRRRRHRRGALVLDGFEGLGARFGENADEIDHHRAAARRRGDRFGIAQVGLDGMDLADLAERLEVAGEVGPPHRDPDAVVALGQRPHHVPADKARAAENGDQGFHGFGVEAGGVGGCGHRRDFLGGQSEVALLVGARGGAGTLRGAGVAYYRLVRKEGIGLRPTPRRAFRQADGRHCGRRC